MGHRYLFLSNHIAGQERYLAITAAHYRRAIGALVVYDIGKKSSFDNCAKWIQDVKEQAEPDITIMLVGNKKDKEHESREVTEAEGQSFADQNKVLFMETSAKDNTNVEGAFIDLLEQIDKNNEKKNKSSNKITGATHLGAGTTFGTLEEDSSGCGC